MEDFTTCSLQAVRVAYEERSHGKCKGNDFEHLEYHGYNSAGIGIDGDKPGEVFLLEPLVSHVSIVHVLGDAW